MVLLGITLTTVVGVASLFAVLVRGLFARVNAAECTADWLNSFDIESYRPVMRLLSQQDYEFLECQPGFAPHIARSLRRRRRQIFRGYLKQLVRDYNRLLLLANMMLVYSREDRPDLARDVARLRREFYLLIVATHLRLAIAPLSPATVNVGRLLDKVELLRDSLYGLIPDASAA